MKSFAFCILFITIAAASFGQKVWEEDLSSKYKEVQLQQKSIVLPNYGIDKALREIKNTYIQMQDQKDSNQIAQSDQSDRDRMFPSIKQALDPKPRTSDSKPIAFDPVKENLDRFKNSPCYGKLGFIPGRDNEALYKECEESLKQKRTGWMGRMLFMCSAFFLLLILIFKFSKK